MIGQTISHYRILEKLGEGGMGVVYRAEDTKLGRCVAMKFLPPHVGTDEEKKSRFIQEARTASVIDHPNIGAIYEINETPDGSMYIVMACYDGDSLKNRIDKGPMEINQAVDLALQIAQGMAKAHERGIIHRDLKPGNVLITNDGIAKIIDFGLAKLSGGIHLTKSGTTLGTVAYMSPEQAQGVEVDARSDVWSLGVMLFEMLTGKLPFRGEFDAALIYSITNENPLPVETFRTALPFDLKLIIARALQKDPKDRYQNMNELVGELKQLQLKSQVGIATGQVVESDWKSVTKSIKYIVRKNKISFVWIPGAILLIALVGFLLKTFLIKPPTTTLSKSIAVLPIINIGEPEHEYFAAGFAEEINQYLSNLPQVLVVSRKSSSLFKNTKLSDSTITEQLGVRYLIKGEMQVLAARLKIKLTMYDSDAGKEVWKENYDIARGEIFTIRREIVNQIAEQLDLDPVDRKTFRYRTSPEVYESYLHGIYYRDKHNKDDNLLAITFFSEAVRKDSNYVPALVSLANSRVEYFRQGWGTSEEHLSDAKYYCQKALQIDSNYAQAYAELGIITDLGGDPQTGLNLYLFELGEPAKGVMYLKQLQEIDPLDWLNALNLGVAYGQIKNYPEAIRSFRRANQLNPQHEWAVYSLGYVYERIAQFDSAIYYYQSALQINPMNPKAYDALVSVLLVNKKFAQAESVMTDAMKYLQDDHNIFYCLGVTYLLGNKQTNARKTFSDGLNFVEGKIKINPGNGDQYAFAGLFNARLGNKSAALKAIEKAAQLDSTNEEVIMKVTRAYAVIGQKSEMLKWFKRVKSMNPEYDAAYLRTAMDFEKYRNDPDLLSAARE
ncbi:MAG: protein kinase [Ignavibacteriales bacterium]|nr:protein kinase [Ignavibacteriales bacterium]